MPVWESLSEREIEVLRLLASGKGNQDIATCLNISINTVEFHLKNIYKKLEISTRIEACTLFWLSYSKTTDFRSDDLTE